MTEQKYTCPMADKCMETPLEETKTALAVKGLLKFPGEGKLIIRKKREGKRLFLYFEEVRNLGRIEITE
ncbi:MAG: hypothetical protein SWK76_17110 [Actinomycetota bacterium]|nr:hypothetical protein [Actinomycetota bacterium]